MSKILSEKEISERLDITAPFLMIDEWQETVPGEKALGRKHLKNDDWFFACHLPKDKAMPASLLMEGMLQTLVLLIYAREPHGDNRSFINDSRTKFLAAPEPGETVTYEAELQSFRRGIAKGTVTGISNGKTICSGEFTYASPHLMVFR